MKKLMITLCSFLLLASCSPVENSVKADNPTQVTSQSKLGDIEIYTIEQQGCKFAIAREFHPAMGGERNTALSITSYGKCEGE